MSDIFKEMNLSSDEKEFIGNIKKDLGHNGDMVIASKGNAIATFFLAKQIEVASKSNDKSSKRMFWLTIVIAVFGFVQALSIGWDMYKEFFR